MYIFTLCVLDSKTENSCNDVIETLCSVSSYANHWHRLVGWIAGFRCIPILFVGDTRLNQCRLQYMNAAEINLIENVKIQIKRKIFFALN